jgi:hypothetical protein
MSALSSLGVGDGQDGAGLMEMISTSESLEGELAGELVRVYYIGYDRS